MNKVLSVCFLCVISFIVSCGPATDISQADLSIGIWRGALDIGDGEEIPFLFDLSLEGKAYIMTIINGKEKIRVNEVSVSGDSLVINMPVFNSSFFLSKTGSNSLTGFWQNFNKSREYRVPFTAEYGNSARFPIPTNPLMDELGVKKWSILFSPGSENESPAIGLFDKLEKGRVLGSFATEKGDYRFLEGLYCDSLLRLSCFDGAHAFLFKANKERDGSFNGNFWSGNSWKEPWVGVPNGVTQLTHADSLTKLIVANEEISFQFPNLEGEMVSLSDGRYKGKAIVLQIMGSWCPNCADETKMYKDLYSQYKDDGLEIIALCFESTRDHKKAAARVKKFKENIGVDYETLIAGYASKKEATQVLGFVDEISSFPTSIFINKNGEVLRIHTGFYGPGTGQYYDEYLADLSDFIPTLLED